MKGLGAKFYFQFIIGFILFNLFIIYPYSQVLAQYYYVNSFEGSDEYGPMEIHLQSINLDQKSIMDNILLPNLGLILYKKPVILNLRNQEILISFSENGGFNKNSDMGLPHYITYYTILRSINGNISPIRIDSLVGQVLSFIKQFPGEDGFRFAITTDSNSNYIMPPGLYSLNQGFRFRMDRETPMLDEPGLRREIAGFDYLHKLPYADGYHIYWSFHNMQYWLIKINSNNDSAIDSLRLEYGGGANTIFAYHPLRDKIYCIHTNYEVHTKIVQKSRQDDHVSPEVLIYDPNSLQLLEQHSILDYPDGNYPGSERGVADVIGEYLVYYFFEEDDISKYAPAMLFIFDTRTNEATWLRVGWR